MTTPWVSMAFAFGVSAVVCLGVGSYQQGRRDAAEELLSYLRSGAGHPSIMACPGDLFERIDKAGGIERPKVTKRSAE